MLSGARAVARCTRVLAARLISRAHARSFGLEPETDKLAARNARFGGAAVRRNAVWSCALRVRCSRALAVQAVEAPEDAAKKAARLARFGSADDSALQAEVAQKKAARGGGRGAAAEKPAAVAAPAAPLDPEFEAKKKARMERFAVAAAEPTA